MTTHDAQRDGSRIPIKVRPGLAVSVTVVTVLLAAFTLPAAVPDRPAFAYFSAGLLGAGALVAVLLGADLLRAWAARGAGIGVKSITLNAFGSRLDLDRRAGGRYPPDPTATGNSAGVLFTSKDARGVHTVVAPAPAPAPAFDPVGAGRAGGGGLDPMAEVAVAARLGRAGLLVTGLSGALLVAVGALAPAGSSALLGQTALWVGTFALLITLVEALPAPRSSGGRILAAAVVRRTGDLNRGEAAVARAGVVTGWALVVLGIVASFLVGLVGLWGLLLGWMVIGSSRLVQAQQKTAAALDGLVVRDVMAPPPPALTAWQTVSEALEKVVVPSGQSVFVVRDFDGSLAGVVSSRALSDVPMDDRGIARVTKAMIPLGTVPTARPRDPLAEAVARLALRPAAGVVLVLDASPQNQDGARDRNDVDVVGVVGPSEITRAVETAPLRGRGGGAGWTVPSSPHRAPH